MSVHEIFVKNSRIRYVQLSCDDCGELTDEYARDYFRRMVREQIAKGWKIYEDRKGWHHYCETCKHNPVTPAQKAKRMLG